jgi:hypothetical protein
MYRGSQTYCRSSVVEMGVRAATRVLCASAHSSKTRNSVACEWGRGEYRNLVRPKRRHRIDGWKKSASEPLPA